MCDCPAPKNGYAPAVVLNFDNWGPPVYLVFWVILNTTRKEKCRSLFDSGIKII